MTVEVESNVVNSNEAAAETGSRDAAVDAAKKVFAEFNKPETPDESTDNGDTAEAKTDAVEQKTEEKPADADKAKAEEPANVMRARQQAQKIREEAQKELDDVRKMRTEVEILKAEYEPLKGRINKLRESPIDALKEMGLEPQDFLDRVIQNGKPDPVKDIASQLAEMQKQLAEMRSEKEELGKKDQAEQHARQIEATKESFFKVASEFDSVKTWIEDDPDDVYYRADNYANWYNKQNGEYPEWSHIASELDKYYTERYNKLINRQKQGVSGEANNSQSTGKAAGKPEAAKKTPANGSSALNSKATAERASGTKAFDEMTPTEQRDYLKKVAEKAMREYTGANQG